jgi:hypothetical protein
MSSTQSHSLDAKSAYRLRQRQLTDLADIWEGTTRQALPSNFIFHQALVVNDFTEVRYAVLTAMKKFCQLDGNVSTNQLVRYFHGVIRRRAEQQAVWEQIRNGSRTSRTV